MIFVQNSHYMFDPNRVHKKRKKWGRLIQSNKDKLEDMLSYHKDAVYEYLLEKKTGFEERERQISLINSYHQGGLRSPPLASGSQSPRVSDTRQNSVSNRKSPKLPPVGFFTVSSNSPRLGTHSPRSPRSPLKGDFRRQ